MKMSLGVKFSLPVILVLTVTFLAGCATNPAVNWDSRVGHYTYSQAVAELGPPDRQARLSDGKSVYKWYVQPPGGTHFNSGMSYYGNNGFGAGSKHRLQLQPTDVAINLRQQRHLAQLVEEQLLKKKLLLWF